jgi:hypothetical protein
MAGLYRREAGARPEPAITSSKAGESQGYLVPAFSVRATASILGVAHWP